MIIRKKALENAKAVCTLLSEKITSKRFLSYYFEIINKIINGPFHFKIVDNKYKIYNSEESIEIGFKKDYKDIEQIESKHIADDTITEQQIKIKDDIINIKKGTRKKNNCSVESYEYINNHLMKKVYYHTLISMYNFNDEIIKIESIFNESGEVFDKITHINISIDKIYYQFRNKDNEFIYDENIEQIEEKAATTKELTQEEYESKTKELKSKQKKLILY